MEKNAMNMNKKKEEIDRQRKRTIPLKTSSKKQTKDLALYAALKAESNFVAGGTVLKLEVQVLRRLSGLPHVPQLIHSGKKEHYCYMVMTLLGDSLVALQRDKGPKKQIF
ncbi:hypothetical protein DICVIV_09567 [Dictyocaulus viviparus]|uniref:Uncharacterized protein n=1 Tax=Dictyocaulus viviparus TaxID=29172 RepID=A0A0D8XPU9_DICVI|nr:hypothetical protein DICVIV_09567 [Dictyocaulus viviparus]